MKQEEKVKVERIKGQIEKKSKRIPFKYTAVGKILTTDPINLLIDKLDDYYYKKEQEKEIKKLVEEGYKGEPDDYEAILEYEQAIRSMPIKSYQDEDGVCEHLYPDGNKVRVKVTLGSIFPSVEVAEEFFKFQREDRLREIEEIKKQLYSKYTGIEPQVIKNMSWGAIDEAILEQSKLSSKLRKVLKR